MISINCIKCRKSFKISGAELSELNQAKKPFVCVECRNKKTEEIKVKATKKKTVKKVSTKKGLK